MSFLIKDDELLEKYNEIWERIKIVSKKNLAGCTQWKIPNS